MQVIAFHEVHVEIFCHTSKLELAGLLQVPAGWLIIILTSSKYGGAICPMGPLDTWFELSSGCSLHGQLVGTDGSTNDCESGRPAAGRAQ